MDIVIILLLVAALVCFIIAAIGAWTPRVNLIALGLAFWVSTVLLPHSTYLVGQAPCGLEPPV
jgi:hypothetical protein